MSGYQVNSHCGDCRQLVGNCCCVPRCPEPVNHNHSSTVVNRSTVINNHNAHAYVPHHRGYVEHHHCGCASSGCGCNEKQKCVAVCLDQTLVCLETITTDGVSVKQATINTGVIGQVLAKFNGQYYKVPAGGVVTVNMTGSAIAQTCGLHALLINGVAVTANDIYPEILEEYQGGCCPKLKLEEVFTSGEASINCEVAVNFMLVS